MSGEKDKWKNNKRAFSEKWQDLWKICTNNWLIKILSLFVAVILWTAIINIDDPYKEKTFVVDVQTINEDALKSVNKVYEVIEGSTAQVRVKGKKSVVDKLRATDILATADLAKLSAVNAVAIVPTLKKTVSSEPILECNDVLKVSLEEMSTKQVKVTVSTEGTPESGYSVGDCMARPNMIEVSGGESVVSKIDSVRIAVNVNGASQSFTRRLLPKAYDSDGAEITSSTLSYSVRKVKVRVEMLKTKTIPVNVDISGDPAAGYEFVKAECLPEKIEVAGQKKDLDAIEDVTIPISIAGMKSSSSTLEQNINIQEYLPEGVNVLEDYALVSLRIDIEKLVTKTVTIPVDSIKFASLPENMTAKVHAGQSYVHVVVQGLESILGDITDDTYTAYVDCENLKAGSHHLSVMVDIGESCRIVKTDKVTVVLKKKKDTSDSKSSPEPDTATPDMQTAEPEPTQDTQTDGQEGTQND